MSEVQKFALVIGGRNRYMEADSSGNWVQASDYDQLKAENTTAWGNAEKNARDCDDLRAEAGHFKALLHLVRVERNAAEHALSEAVRLLEAYGGGVSEIEEWLKNK